MSPIRFTIADGIATITFDNPSSRANTMSTAAWTALGDTVDQVAASKATGLVINSAKDGMFIAGADLAELAELPTDNDAPAKELVAAGHRVLTAIEALPCTTVAAIDGACLGGGLEVAMACDFRAVGPHPKTKLGLPEVKLCLIPGWGGTQRLPRIIGFAKAIDLLCTGRSVSADEAITLRLADGDLSSIPRLLSSDPSERRRTKSGPMSETTDWNTLRMVFADLHDEERMAAKIALKAVQFGASLRLSAAIELEAAAFVQLLSSDAARQRIAKFLKK